MVKFISFPESCPHFKSHRVQIHLRLLASSALHTRATQNRVHKIGCPWPHPTTTGSKALLQTCKGLGGEVKKTVYRLSPLICCGTSPLRCSAKLSWVKTATELMVDGVPNTVRGSHCRRMRRGESGTASSPPSPKLLSFQPRFNSLLPANYTPLSPLTPSNIR